jgi:hypothetical protein
MDVHTNFILVFMLLDEVLSMVIVLNFEVMLGQILKHSLLNYVILCNVVS